MTASDIIFLAIAFTAALTSMAVWFVWTPYQ